MNEMAVTRKDILTDLTIRDKYIEGVKLLKNDFLRPNWPNTFDIFIIWHFNAMMNLTPPNGNGRNAAHMGPSFLPWHRWMLLLLENHLQRVLGDDNFGLPYWNWAIDGDLSPSHQADAPIWSDSYMGGFGSPVESGPFASGSWQVNITQLPNGSLISTNRGLRRSLRRGANGLPTTKEVRDAVHRNGSSVFYDTSPWDRTSFGFRNEIEGWLNGPRLHNLVHVWIGDDMALGTSPNDPIFYLNHCNVDRIWGGWQQIHSNPPYLPDNDQPSFLQGHRLNDFLYEITQSQQFDPIFRGRVRPADLIDVSERYTYDSYSDIL